MSKNLFRQEAFDKIESPERLNEMVRITSSKDWIVLLSLSGIIIAIIFWSFFGQISYSVNGSGILLLPAGIQEVASVSDGKVERLYVEEGMLVEKGDLIGLIEQPELHLTIITEKEKLKDYLLRFERISRFGSDNLEMKQALNEKEELSLMNAINSNEARLLFFKEKIQAEEELLEKGLITKETLNNTKNQYFNLQLENETLRNNLIRIQQTIFRSKEEVSLELQTLRSEILAIESSINTLSALYELKSKILSPCQGKVIEIMVNPGRVIKSGNPIVRIEPHEITRNLEAIIYVDPRDGKKIQIGMKAKISPSTIRIEEFGYIMGEIVKVSEYPATYQGMLSALGNEVLVQSFLRNEPPIALNISLDLDSSTYSGFSWSSIKGPNQEIRSGTLSSAKIVVENKRPISLLIPEKSNKPFLWISKKIKNTFKTDIIHTDEIPEDAEKNKSANPESIDFGEEIFELVQEATYTIQILASRDPASQKQIDLVYSGKQEVKVVFKDNWYKYSIGEFRTIDEAESYIRQEGLSTRFFITKINK